MYIDHIYSTCSRPKCDSFRTDGSHTVDLVIFACLVFREFLILGLFTKFIIREFVFFFSSAIIIIIIVRYLNSRICPPREIRENQNLANITRTTVYIKCETFRSKKSLRHTSFVYAVLLNIAKLFLQIFQSPYG